MSVHSCSEGCRVFGDKGYRVAWISFSPTGDIMAEVISVALGLDCRCFWGAGVCVVLLEEHRSGF
jgi:hypothetical protein